MMTFDELKAQLIASGVPETVADTVAAGKLAEMMTRNAERSKADRDAVAYGVNDSGIQCPLKRGRKGSLLPVCDAPTAVFRAFSTKSKAKTEFGPVLRVHFREHVSDSGYVQPEPLWIPSQSSASIEPAENSACWQALEMVAATPGMRFAIQDREGAKARTIDTAEEWLDECRAALMEFAGDLKAIRSGR